MKPTPAAFKARRREAIELGDGTRLEILYEDRSVLAIDKPARWMLVPFNWQRTDWNLQAALESCVVGGAFWARQRNLRFLRHIHRLDAETSGILLFARSPGALETYSRLFAGRAMDKRYLAVVTGRPRSPAWSATAKLGPDPHQHGRIVASPPDGKPTETRFRTLATTVAPGWGECSLVEAKPITGRTHQIRVHLSLAGHPVLGDTLYSKPVPSRPQHPMAATRRRNEPPCAPARTAASRMMPREFPLALRAGFLSYADPFTRRPVTIRAPMDPFLAAFGFATAKATLDWE